MEDDATIRNNEATGGGVIHGGGGILFWWGGGEATLKDNSLVTENKCSYGGGVYAKWDSSDFKFVGGSMRGSSFEHPSFQTGSIRGNFGERGPDIFENHN